jgi:alpha-2-macroglobulin
VARQVGIAELRRGVSIVLQGDGPFWISEDVAGTPVRAPEVREDPVRIARAYYRTDGSLFEGGTLKEGETLIAKLTLESKEAMPDALVVDLLPAGIEIENLALGDRGALGELVLDGITLSQREYAAELRHEEFRDDRYVAALKLHEGSPAHLFYLVRAVSPGTFVVPPPTIEDMYRPRLQGIGRSLPQTLEVTPP